MPAPAPIGTEGMVARIETARTFSGYNDRHVFAVSGRHGNPRPPSVMMWAAWPRPDVGARSGTDEGLRRMAAILGISAFYHDSAAALVLDGRIVAAAQEERFTRIKHDAAFPAHAIRLLPAARRGCPPADLDYVAFYDKPLTKFERLLETYLAYAPAGFRSFRLAMPLVAQGQAAHAADLARWPGRPKPHPADLHRPS